jgi:hypothetical protein
MHSLSVFSNSESAKVALGKCVSQLGECKTTPAESIAAVT